MRPRIDPRQNLGAPGPRGLPRWNRAAKPKLRTNPHLESRARVRRDFHGGMPRPTAVVAASTPVHVPAPDAPLVLVVSIEGDVWPGAEASLLGTAREIWPGHAHCLVAVGLACDPESAGADQVMLLPRIDEHVVLELVKGMSPSHVVMADAGCAADVCRRVAARSGQDAAFNIVAQKPGKVTCLLDGGLLETTVEAPFLLCLPRRTCASYEGEFKFEAKVLPSPHVPQLASPFQDEGLLPSSASDIPLIEAELVLSGGAGLSAWKEFGEVADMLRAAVAGSRVVCDAGHLPRDRQVGASGKQIEAQGYVALGISGAPQHLQGIRGCRHVIAVNMDPHAPIMARADLAIVGDADVILRELRDLLEQEAGA